MSASSFILAHRYGNSGIGPSGYFPVRADLFGDDGDDEVEFDAVELEDIEELDMTPTVQPVGTSEALKAIATAAAQAMMKMVPYPVTYDVRMGQDRGGNPYSQLVLRCHDPYKLLAQASSWLLQSSGASGVSVSSLPTKDPNEIVLVFSRGIVPVVFQPGR